MVTGTGLLVLCGGFELFAALTKKYRPRRLPPVGRKFFTAFSVTFAILLGLNALLESEVAFHVTGLVFGLTWMLRQTLRTCSRERDWDEWWVPLVSKNSLFAWTLTVPFTAIHFFVWPVSMPVFYLTKRLFFESKGADDPH